ncbi:MAG: sialidase family protein [Candidatus Dormibacteria bacterium]
MRIPFARLRDALLLLVLAAPALSGQAATPPSGTLQPGGSLAWDFLPVDGAYATPYQGPAGTGVEEKCPPVQCDNFDLTVQLPGDPATLYGSQVGLLSIRYTWVVPPGNAPEDLDVYALGPDAKETVHIGPGLPDYEYPEEDLVVSNPVNGVYHIRSVANVTPVATAAHAVATLSLVPRVTAPSPTLPSGSPTFINYVPPTTVANSQSAGEPSIGVNLETGAIMYEASSHQLKVLMDDSKSPPAATWINVDAPTSQVTEDPILFTDQRTNRTFETQLAGSCSLTEYSDDDGASWTPSQGCGEPSGVDHETTGGGPYPAALKSMALTSYPDAVYFCSQDLVTAFCERSDDGGATFGQGVATYQQQCAGIHGHIKVAPDGTVYLPNRYCGTNASAIVSTDAGQTWTIRPVPGSTPGNGDPSIGIGSGGTVYLGYNDESGRAMIAVSHDQGRTWSTPVNVGVPYGIQNSEFPEVTAGDDNRAAYAFLGTTTQGQDQQANFGCTVDGSLCPDGVWHMYVAFTYDGGATWTTVDATPNDPVQRTCIWNEGGGVKCRNLLDFNDATTDRRGRVLLAYTDGCVAACVTSTKPSDNTFASLTTMARQQCGRGLYAAYDPGPGNCRAAPIAAPQAAALPNTAAEAASPWTWAWLLALPLLLSSRWRRSVR